MWETEMVNLLRALIGDMDEGDEQRYSDSRLQQVILAAAQLVQTDIEFDTEYIIDVDEVRLEPDPTDRDAGTRDNWFINLVSTRAACFIDSLEARAAASQAITIRDGSSMISLGGTGGMLQGALAVWEKGACAAYQKMKDDYNSGDVDSPGAIIVSAYGRAGGFGGCGYPVDGRYR